MKLFYFNLNGYLKKQIMSSFHCNFVLNYCQATDKKMMVQKALKIT